MIASFARRVIRIRVMAEARREHLDPSEEVYNFLRHLRKHLPFGCILL
jgi:hypothetical protein